VHLKMTGNLLVIPDYRLHTHTVRAVFELADGRGLVLDDGRLLGHVHLYTEAELASRLADIGVDPLSRAFTPELLIDAAVRSAKPAKVFLMDQKPVSGLGNIYAAEALFRARIHPAKRVNTLRRPKLIALHKGIQDTLRAALPEAIKSYRKPDQHEGMTYFVYDREGQPCRVCGKAIQRFEQAGRSTYYCPRCQRATAL
jgi:formamidopyrimidine-DNA glycosylase